MITCPRCGTANPDGFRFCGNCAAPLTASTAEGGERRKVVTVLFCDVAGSTSLGETRDPEQMRAIMARYFEMARGALERHGGTVEKFIGDAVMAVFGHPVLHEDDALRAVRAAADLRAELAALNAQLEQTWGTTIEVRVGVNTGPVVAGEPGSAETLVTGDAVNVAARLQTAAEPGETLIGGETYQAVRDAVTVEEVPPLALKGKELPVNAWRLMSVVADALGRARHLDSPLVGRERERRALDEAFEEAVSDQTCVLFTLLGSAGVGKSRLVHEFLREAGRHAHVLRGRCLPYGEGITFWPLAEVVKGAAGINDVDSAEAARAKLAALLPDDDQRGVIVADVAAAIGLSDRQGSGEEIFWAARRLFELMAAERPLIVVLDDIHWAEPTFLDMIEHIADWSRDAPIILLCIARPELLEVRPAWAGGKLHATTLLLEALPSDHVTRLVKNLLGEGALADSIVHRIAEVAEGNPLFVEEFVAMLIDDGMLSQENGRWQPTGDLDRVTVPPTIRSLLAARIDRLDRRERSVIERASVVGKIFWQGAVSELAPEPLRPDVRQSLLGLVRKELVRPDRSDFAGDEAFRFRHLLLRDAAYEGLPKQDRSQLHERFAGWLERTAGERVAEYEEVLGYHLEQAYRYRAELGTLDDGTVGLGLRAARLLGAAGLRASDRNDVTAARSLLGRAAALFPPEHAERLPILLELSDAAFESGHFERAIELLDETSALAEKLDDQRVLWRATVARGQYGFNHNPEGTFEEGMRLLEQAIPELDRLADDFGLALAWDGMHDLHYFRGDLATAREDALRMLEHARRAGSEGQELGALIALASLGVWDETPVDQAIAAADDALARARAAGRRLPEAQGLGIKGRLLSMVGEYDEALRLIAQGRATLRELGRVQHAAGASHWVGVANWYADDPAAAAEGLREGAEALDEMGEKLMLSSSFGDMSVALAKQGRFDDALDASKRAEALTLADDPAAQISWRTGRALALAGLGHWDEAGQLARQALDLCDAEGHPIHQAGARVDLAPVVAEVFGRDTAIARLREARAYFEHKGVRPVVERIDAQLLQLQSQGVGDATAAGA